MQINAICEGGISAFPGRVKTLMVLEAGPEWRGQVSVGSKLSFITFQRSGHAHQVHDFADAIPTQKC